ncbi:MAG: hypothetical protein JXK94_10770 [Deltaproteobacteria bacterium]|nr:hypothetical protein [Deltaproteobacteria bacterium]
MEYKVDFVDGYFDVKLFGKSCVEESAAYFDYLITHKQWRPGSLVISDETDLEIRHLTINDLEKIAKVCEERRTAIGSARFAAVVPQDLLFGMNRMFQVYVDPYWDATIDAFRSRDEALAWLLSI